MKINLPNKEGEAEMTPRQKEKLEKLKNKKLEITIKKKIISLRNAALKNKVLDPTEIAEIEYYIEELESIL